MIGPISGKCHSILTLPQASSQKGEPVDIPVISFNDSPVIFFTNI